MATRRFWRWALLVSAFAGAACACCTGAWRAIAAEAAPSAQQAAKPAAPATEPASEEGYLHARPEDLKHWQEMRFGLFVHWGPVSLKGTEIGWSRAGERRGHRTAKARTGIPVEVYDNLYKEFNPVRFDAAEWVRIAKDAGMKYLVFTTKHHDGFVNFDSKLTDYKITSPLSPYGKDIVKQIADACRAGGLVLGFYYSPPDWHHPDYRNGDRHARYVEYLHGQLRELCTNYGKVGIIWFDGLGGKAGDWSSPRLFRTIRRLQPDVVINNRAGLDGDFYTPEQRVGGFDRERPWETCMTICRQWAWKPNDTMKSLEQCLRTLVQVAGGDGNLLFNVGPMPDGRIEPRQAERLREMGAWLAKHGRSIYGTRGGPFKPGKWGASTCWDNRIYVHVFRWPEEGKMVLPPINAKVLKNSLLTGGSGTVRQTDAGVEIAVAQEHRRPIDTIVVLELDGPALAIPPVAVRWASRSLACGKKATASNVFRNMKQHGPDKAFDDDPETRWATGAGTKQAWLEVDLGETVTIDRARIEEWDRRVRQFTLECRLDGQWQVLHKGSGLGAEADIRFKPVAARYVRLNILRASEGPTIKELQLFGPGQAKATPR